MKVPLAKVKFLYGNVSFPIYITELGREIDFEISNADIRPEFEVMKDYFARILKSKLIKVEIAIRYSSGEIISAAATSEDINSINNSVIENVRFEFVKRQILKPDP